MIEEAYVSFETAKLLKEKGFDESCEGFYVNSGVLSHTLSNANNSKWYGDKSTIGYISAPTLQMAMRWLREVHNLVIQTEIIDFLEHGEVWLYTVIERKTIKKLTGRDEDFTEHSYEEAVESAIKYCLENLI